MSATITTKAAAPTPSAAPATPSPGAVSTEANTAISEADIASALAALGAEEPATDDSSPETLAPDSDESAAPEATAPEGEAASQEVPAASSEAAAAETADPSAADSAANGDAEQPAEGDPEPSSRSNAKVPEGVQRRIDELTARSKGAEETVAALQQRLAAYEARDAGRLTPDVLETIDDPSALEKAKSQWSQLHHWAAKHINAPEATLGEKTYSPEEVAQIFAHTSELLTDAAPRRAAYLQERARFDAGTAQVYPWAADSRTGLGQVLHQALTQLPQLRQLPNGRLIAADSLVGSQLRNAGITVDEALIKRLVAEKSRTPAKPAAANAPSRPTTPPARRPVPPSAPGRPGAMPARLSERDARIATAEKRMERENGSVASLAASIAAKL